MRQALKNPVLDWIEAFLQAAFLVLLINQYFLQAYQIPSGSMIDTLLLGDRIFVNKVIYGPELLPGVVKLPGLAQPDRGDVIIFENPSYIGRGTGFTILQRVLYMVTLSLVDIDRDESGEPRAQLLIKRAVATAGDQLRTVDGNIEIKAAGSREWRSEAAFASHVDQPLHAQRLLTADAYDVIERGGRALAMQDLGLPRDTEMEAALAELRQVGFGDPFALEGVRQSMVYAARAHAPRSRERVQFIRTGWYVPPGRIFPLGDNRDNSRDARYFGAVPLHDVLGRAMIIYWPLNRAGRIR